MRCYYISSKTSKIKHSEKSNTGKYAGKLDHLHIAGEM